MGEFDRDDAERLEVYKGRLEAENAQLRILTENANTKLSELAKRILHGSDDDGYWSNDISELRKLAKAALEVK